VIGFLVSAFANYDYAFAFLIGGGPVLGAGEPVHPYHQDRRPDAAGLNQTKEKHARQHRRKKRGRTARLIGSKQVSPVELLEACIARIEDHQSAHQCRHRHLLRARPRRGRAAEQAVMDGRRWACCTACPSASRTWKKPQAC
jgi:hypothetical protein